MAIDTKRITAEDLFAMDPDRFDYELVRGDLVRMPPPGFRHAVIVTTIAASIHAHVVGNKLGLVASNGGFRIEHDPDTVLAPDVAFMSQKRLEATESNVVGYPDALPEFVLEVVSPSDLARDVHRKVQIYLSAGITMVVVVWPEDRQVTVAMPGGTTRTLGSGDQLDCTSVFPGYSLEVEAIFVSFE